MILDDYLANYIWLHLQAFWPSLVMKKWLNIKPKVYDFSEDEVDTETESEDDGMVLACLPLQVICFAFSAWLWFLQLFSSLLS